MLLQTQLDPDLRDPKCGDQVSHAHQIVGGAGEGKDPVHFAHPAMANLPHERYGLQPAEAFFDPLPLLLADGVTRVPCGAAINRAAAAPLQVLCQMRHHAQVGAGQCGKPESPPTEATLARLVLKQTIHTTLLLEEPRSANDLEQMITKEVAKLYQGVHKTT